MDVKTLYTLTAIADRGSMAKAGDAIGLSLSAVSMQMRGLEEELGMRLFDRSRRPPVLTDAGLALTHRARELLAHWESMTQALKRDAASGLLKLGAAHSCVSGVLPLALARMQRRGHAIDIHLTTGLTHDLERAVVNRTMVQAEIERRRIAVQSTMEIDNLEGVVAMVGAGLGASVVPARGVANEFPSTIRTLPFGQPPITRRLGLLVPRDNPRAHLSRVLLEALRESSAPGQRR